MSLELLQPTSAENPIVFMDINIGHEFAGRLIIELRKDVVPKTAENFRALCTGECGIGQLGKPLHYKGTRFHKVTKIYVAQGGDVINNDGSCGESIYGPTFEDENFLLTHEEGVVSMTNYGSPNTNNSQFVITSVSCSNLDKTNVVVGKVLRGLGILTQMEQNVDDNGEPQEEFVIVDCGEITNNDQWHIEDNDETADNLPLYPADWQDTNQRRMADEIVSILTSMRLAGNHFFAKSSYYDAIRKYRKATRYYNHFRKQYDWQDLPKHNENNQDLQKIDAFAALNNLNFATVALKLQQYDNAKYSCTEAIRLDANCNKAYYRRGQAHMHLKNYENAIEDFQKAHELLPANKQILNALNDAKKALAEYNRNQMNALKTLFK